MVAVLAHGLALIQRDILHEPADPDRCASAALFHDASEILTGDLPTPIKYYNPDIKHAYKQIESVSCEKLLGLLLGFDQSGPQLTQSFFRLGDGVEQYEIFLSDGLHMAFSFLIGHKIWGGTALSYTKDRAYPV